ncbi:uncharacterized protein RHO17_006325 [Thomomys bottae]
MRPPPVRQCARGGGARRARGGLSVPQQPRGPPPDLANGRAWRRHVLAAAAAAAGAETGAASATRAAAAAAAAARLRCRGRGRTRWRRRLSRSGDWARAERGGADQDLPWNTVMDMVIKSIRCISEYKSSNIFAIVDTELSGDSGL